MRLRAGAEALIRKPGTAALICPGGGYECLSVQDEGIGLAEYLEQKGFAAYVLLYRAAPNRYPGPQGIWRWRLGL